MHMPKRWGIPVLIAVAVCLGAYYVFVVRSERVGDWEVYQGVGRVETDSAVGFRYLDVSYTVHNVARPLFSYVRTARPRPDNAPCALAFECQSEWPAALLVVVTESDGSVYQARTEIEHADWWKQVSLPETAFVLRPTSGNKDENGRLDLRQLRARPIEFYDGSGVTAPSTAFSNRLKITPPGFATAPATPSP
jgi:hypothetical protein